MSPPAPLSAATVLERPVSERPDGEAVVARSGRLTYRELDDLATRNAAALLRSGVRPGDRVAVSLPNDLTLVAAFLGAMRLGAIWIGINRQLAAPEKAYILKDAEASLFIGDAEMVAQVRQLKQVEPRGREAGGALEAITADGEGSEWANLTGEAWGEPAAPPDPLAPAAIAYTSGTTGRPKGVVHSQHNLMLPGAVLVASRSYGPALRKADCFPLTILNLQVLSTLLVAQAEGTAIVMDRVDPAGIAQWIAAERATTFNGAPAMLYGLATDDTVDPVMLGSLDDVWSGGSHCPERTQELFTAKFHLPVHTTYGLTEAPAVVSILPRDERAHAHTSGRPLPHLSVVITGGDGRPARPDEVGEIAVSPASEGTWAEVFRPMAGYWRQTEASRAAVRDGTLFTGDLGRLDDDGYLVVEERQSSVILRGGANVYPAEVERVLDDHPAVAASCVVGVPDERLGERVAAAVEPSRVGADPESLRRHCEASLARYKVPETFLVASLPRNSMGKVVRAEVARAVIEQRTGREGNDGTERDDGTARSEGAAR